MAGTLFYILSSTTDLQKIGGCIRGCIFDFEFRVCQKKLFLKKMLVCCNDITVKKDDIILTSFCIIQL